MKQAITAIIIFLPSQDPFQPSRVTFLPSRVISLPSRVIMTFTGSLSPCRQKTEEKENRTLRSGSRREATHYSADDTERLEAVYARDRYPDYVTREHLAFLLQRTEMQIQTWFQNRRCRDRKAARKLPPPLKLDPSITTSLAVKTPKAVIELPVLPRFDNPSDVMRSYRTAKWCSAHAIPRHDAIVTQPLDLSKSMRHPPQRASPTASTNPSHMSAFSFLQKKPLAVVSPVSSERPVRTSLMTSTPCTSHRRLTHGSFVFPPESFLPDRYILLPTPNSGEHCSPQSSVSTVDPDPDFFSRPYHVTQYSPAPLSDGASASTVSHATSDSDIDDSTIGRGFIPVRPWEEKPKDTKFQKPPSLTASHHYASNSSPATLSHATHSPFGHSSHLTSSRSSLLSDLVRSPHDWLWSEFLSSPRRPLSPIDN